ncbi:MAG: hypothetical protein A3B90_00740 [Candidatus Magasanikbacteria bacterium RIFCSPHIGHO2_02_FULL_41_13]|uniref:Dephospho-CoA kinase n=1 Tax=Candidatus Magasanikbacteria bacterium RIFCSPHIGHO2_02_FULL_41_13 TaxID=1798676 RepID=A0A1F6M4I6_9BACT|nr:MAG: hypothetical protein A3B90_00740 [Candidatus Magasanikbacteria bacterium RIFCSPHIGHO2_02_FULL_41_13]
MNKLYAIVGMAGSGKSTVAQIAHEKGFGFLRFGQITIDEVHARGMEVNPENEKMVREDIRAHEGMGGYAKRMIPKFDALLETSSVVADGLYSWAEYKILKEYYGEKMIVVCIFVPPELRYSRLEQRVADANDLAQNKRQLTREQARARDYAEIENIEKGGPIAMADITIQNTGTIEEFLNELRKYII